MSAGMPHSKTGLNNSGGQSSSNILSNNVCITLLAVAAVVGEYKQKTRDPRFAPGLAINLRKIARSSPGIGQNRWLKDKVS